MKSKILGEGGRLAQFSCFMYVTYCHLACFRHLWLALDGI